MSAHESDMDLGRLLRFVVFTALVGFFLNEIWEVAQMFAYIRPPGSSSMSEFSLCSRAAVGDAVIILGICAIGALASRDPGWGLSGAWNVYATSSILGVTYATLLERWAVAEGRWAYAESMPIVPMLDAGLWPLLQMVLLPPLSVYVARWWTLHSAV